VALFTGQWADLPLAELAAKCGDWRAGDQIRDPGVLLLGLLTW
jgi:hypothetical protein